MLAAFYVGPGQIEVKKVAAPKPGPGEVLVKVGTCGICGSDLHFYRGDIPILSQVSPGHELAGEIVALGDGVEGWECGQRVIIEPLKVCRECSYCRSGQYQLCNQRKLMGTFIPGGMAQYLCAPAYGLYSLPDSLSYDLGAMVEPLAVAVHALHLAELALGERVLVLGSGSIGLMVVLAARAAGAEDIVTTYRYPHQGEAALAAGAQHAITSNEAGTPALMAEAQRRPFDLVVETVGGQADTVQQAVNVVRPGGRVCLLGLFTQSIGLNPLLLALKEVRIVGGLTYCRPGQQSDFDAALGIIEAAPERAQRLISHRFSLEQAATAFAAAADKSTRSLKVQLHP